MRGPDGRLEDHSAVLAEARPYGRLDVRATRLGLDWIAGVLDNQDPLGGKDDEFFEELAAFRKTNHQSCHAPAGAGAPILPPPGAAQTAKVREQPQPAYRVNERLFPEELDAPLDRAADAWGEAYSRFVRVSVPRHRIAPAAPVGAPDAIRFLAWLPGATVVTLRYLHSAGLLTHRFVPPC